MVIQKQISLKKQPRGFHLVTGEIVNQLGSLKPISTGIAHFFICHTSASLTLNENADPTVREDFEKHFNHSIPENAPYYKHTLEGADDMPAHLKSSLLGASVMLPVTNGRLNPGTWQGIYLCEHRNHASARRLIITVFGE